LRQANVLNFITVYDFTYEYYRSGIVRRVHSFQKARAIKRADGIICISENTKKDLKKFYPDIDGQRIRVIYLGISDDFFPLKEKKNDLLDVRDDKKVILYLGSRMKYKNFDLAVEVVSSLTEYKLTIVGGGELTKSEMALLRKKLGARFHYVSSLSPVQLNGLYNSAFCLLYPSLYEGFGLPIGEAMKAGCPVVTTGFSSIPEVCGDSCLMVDSVEPEVSPDTIEQASLDGEAQPVPVMRRNNLDVGRSHSGPMLVIDVVATTFVAAGWCVELHDNGCLMLERTA